MKYCAIIGKDGRKIFIDRAEMPASRVRVMMLGGVARFRNTGVVTDFGPFICDERRANSRSARFAEVVGQGGGGSGNFAAIVQGAGKAKWGTC